MSYPTRAEGLVNSTTPGQSGLGSDGNKGVLRILQSSSITEALLSDCLVSYPGHSFGVAVLLFCRDAVGVFYYSSRLGYTRWGSLTPCWYAVGVFCNPSWLDQFVFLCYKDFKVSTCFPSRLTYWNISQIVSVILVLLF